MSLRFVFHLITRVIWWLRLSRREETWKTAEIAWSRDMDEVFRTHSRYTAFTSSPSMLALGGEPVVGLRRRRRRPCRADDDGHVA